MIAELIDLKRYHCRESAPFYAALPISVRIANVYERIFLESVEVLGFCCFLNL